MSGRAVLTALALAIWAAAAPAAIIVDPPLPITQRVTVQLIQTALDNGTSPATVFGNATQRADIEAGIDSIWAQAGIDIHILPAINRYNDTFAYQGYAGSGTRPSSDFSTILANANSAGVLSPDALVLNLILVNVVPAFAPLSENTAAGYARINGNGMIGFVGDNLLTFGNGRDVIAGVMAHEIGHNLGLDHTGSNLPNLMSPSGSTDQLNSTQINTATLSRFARAIPAQIAGDFNGDGTVDAADYAVWRRDDGTQQGYNAWRDNFGDSLGSGPATVASSHTAVPEPTSAMLAIGLLLACSVSTGRKRRTRPQTSALAHGRPGWSPATPGRY